MYKFDNSPITTYRTNYCSQAKVSRISHEKVGKRIRWPIVGTKQLWPLVFYN